MSVVINQSGTTTIIAAVAGKTQFVYGYVLSCSAEVVVRFDDTTDVPLTGPMTIEAKKNLTVPYDPNGQFVTVAGRGVKLVYVSGSGTLGGHASVSAYG